METLKFNGVVSNVEGGIKNNGLMIEMIRHSKYLCMIVLKRVIQLLSVKVEYVNIENCIIESPDFFLSNVFL